MKNTYRKVYCYILKRMFCEISYSNKVVIKSEWTAGDIVVENSRNELNWSVCTVCDVSTPVQAVECIRKFTWPWLLACLRSCTRCAKRHNNSLNICQPIRGTYEMFAFVPNVLWCLPICIICEVAHLNGCYWSIACYNNIERRFPMFGCCKSPFKRVFNFRADPFELSQRIKWLGQRKLVAFCLSAVLVTSVY